MIETGTEDDVMVTIINDTVTIVCYGREQKMKRKEAMDFYYGCISCSEGSEQDRYVNIYRQLINGKTYCTDETETWFE